jgi:uncharacterized protein YcbX
MVTIAELGLAPGKSMRAYEDVQVLQIGERGVLGDREYMWVEAEPYTYKNYKQGKEVEPGRFISQREDPQLTGIVPTLESDGLRLTWQNQDGLFVPRAEDVAANRTHVSVWGWEGEAVDQGDEAADWGEAHIGRPVHLVAISDEMPRYVEDNPSLGRVSFADGYAVTVGSTTSFNTVNSYMEAKGKSPIPTNRARATIILDGLEVDGEQFPEDYVQAITIAHNGLTLVLERWKACSRCPIPDTDQQTGQRDRDTWVRPALGKLGRTGKHFDTERFGHEEGLFLTQNHVVRLPKDLPPGTTIPVQCNATVDIVYSDTTNWVRRVS